MLAPEDDYTQRLQAREARAAQLRQLQDRIGGGRLIMAVVIVATIWYLHGRAMASGWLAVPVVGFVALVIWHMRARREHCKAQRAVDFYQRGLGRLRDKWAGTGQQGQRFIDPHHVYSGDLDLFGEGSLFELLCAVRTRMGEETLARWLASPATVQEIRGRQGAVNELRTRVALREELATLGEEASVGVYPGGLLKWAATPNGLDAAWIRWVAIVLPLLAVATALLWWLRGLASPFIAVVLVEAGILAALGKQINQVINGTENSFDGLNLFAQMLLRVEHEPSQAPALQTLGGRLRSHSLPPSRTMSQLATIANLAGSRRNQILATLAVPLLYTLWVALAAERWRARHHAVVQSWADVVGEFEALVSLAGYGYEHPEDPFPEFVDLPTGSFAGMSLGHPLIPAARCVRNDVAIEAATRGLLISGSNMSGKSTLMRTVGINTVLAMAGAPVRARKLRLTPLQVGASIRVNDSLQEGSSRFYAEIKRLRQLLDLAERRNGIPLLFLLDELLQGTNSHDRRIGAEGIVRGFLKRGAIGLITTHDLAITDIAGLEAGALHNVHFQDELVDGRMTFDFTLREGIVTKSNGVELMRSLGLEV